MNAVKNFLHSALRNPQGVYFRQVRENLPLSYPRALLPYQGALVPYPTCAWSISLIHYRRYYSTYDSWDTT